MSDRHNIDEQLSAAEDRGAEGIEAETELQTVKILPSEEAVQERLQQEIRKLKQSGRAKQANRTAHKASGKKSRQKSYVAEL